MDDDDPRLIELWMDLAEDREGGGLRGVDHYLERHRALGSDAVARAWITAADEAEPASEDGGARRIGPYRLERELGRGGQGVVYLAVHAELGRRVALKVLAPGAIGGDAARLRFEREAAVAAGLEHPGLGTVFESGREDGVDFLAMQWLPGGSLAEALARDGESTSEARALRPPHGGREPARPLGERAAIDAVARLVADAARALHAAHCAGVVHRDVKPSNLLFDAEGRPVWVDFGLARDASRAALTVSGEQLGTPAYMAPEQVEGQAVDARADVWALGALLFETLTLRRAFDRPSVEATLLAIVGEDPPRLRRVHPRVPRDLGVICATALERDARRRYRSAAALADDLERFLEHRPIDARPAPAWLRAWRWAQRYPAGAAAAAVVLLSAATIGAIVGNFRAERRGVEAQRDAAIAGQAQLTDREVAESLTVGLDRALWPIAPPLVERADAWLAELERLERDLPGHRATLAELRSRAGAAAERDPAEERLEQFLTELVEDVVALAPHRERVLEHRARAELHGARTLEHREWATCGASIAASPLYAELELRPQLGLIPLGPNAAGLWEFWVYESGARPAFEPDTGAVPREGDGVVLVLLPGGLAHVGCHPVDGPNLDSDAQYNELPPHAVALDPFFMAKFELTQDQWRRIDDGRNPSGLPVGHTPDGVEVVTALHPVEQVARGEGSRVLARLGLTLPTEVQWEYAARAGTTTRYAFGADETDSAAHGNFFADEARASSEQHPNHATKFGYSDGWVRHAPVGRFPPNPFGLHDLHGNVFEWCADDYLAYELSARAGDGLRSAETAADRGVIRGGCFYWPATYGRSSQRVPYVPSEVSFDLGLRAARALDPAPGE